MRNATPAELAERLDAMTAAAKAEIARLRAELAKVEGELAKARDFGGSAVETAGVILNYLGVGQDASLEPGADRRRDRIAAWIDKAAEARALAAEARMGKVVKALEPFAEAAASYDPDEGDGANVAWSHDFTIASLRRARSALAKETTS